MNTWKVIFATMVIFGTGVITGALVVRQSGNFRPHPRPADNRGQRPLSPAALAEGGVPQAHVQRIQFLNRVQLELELNPEQRTRIERIITEGQEQTKELWEPVAKQMRQELQRVRERIRVELTLEQRVRFEELLKLRQPRKPGEPPLPDRLPRNLRRSPANPPPVEGAPQSPPSDKP